MLKDWQYKLKVLFYPPCWYQQNIYSSVWHSTLIKLMSENSFNRIDKYTAKLGEVELWVSNYPYACFSDYRTRIALRPKRWLVLKLLDKYIEDTMVSSK